MFLPSVIFIFSSVLIAHAITPENLIQSDDLGVTQILATHYDCSKQYNLRQFRLTQVQKCTQASTKIECTRTLAVFFRAKAKKN